VRELRLSRPGRPLLFTVVAALGLASCAIDSSPNQFAGQTWGPASYSEYEAARAEWGAKYVVCARKYGAAAILHPDGTITDAVAQGRPTTALLDAGCIDEVGPPPESPPLTPELLKGLYAMLVRQADCLREKGYDISNPPSERTWAENYSLDSWNPLLDVRNAGLDVATADGKCPQPDIGEAWRTGYASS